MKKVEEIESNWKLESFKKWVKKPTRIKPDDEAEPEKDEDLWT